MWLHFFSLDEVRVVPAVMCSPLRVAAEHMDVPLDKIGPNLSCGLPMPLLEWQCGHGFANVQTQVLMKLRIHRKLVDPDPAAEKLAAESDDMMAIQLCKSVMPDIPLSSATT